MRHNYAIVQKRQIGTYKEYLTKQIQAIGLFKYSLLSQYDASKRHLDDNLSRNLRDRSLNDDQHRHGDDCLYFRISTLGGVYF